MSDAPRKNVVPLRPRAGDLEKLVHELAADSRKVKFTDHALDRMEERDISMREAYEVLTRGTLSGPIDAGRGTDELKCKLTRSFKGRRDIGVVTVVFAKKELRVLTVEWETKV